METAQSRSGSMKSESSDLPVNGMTDAIRRLSALISRGAGCAEVVTAAAKSAAAMLPGARISILSVDEKWKSGKVVAGSSGLPGQAGSSFVVLTYSDLRSALEKPHTSFRGTYRDMARLFGDSAAGATISDEVVIYKLMPCNHDSSMVIVAAVASRQVVQTEGVLGALGELLSALQGGYDVSTSLGNNLGQITRAKAQWERAVDLMPELVCLLDAEGRIVRINRTVERWGLGKVSEVPGRILHQVLHPECEDASCVMNCVLSRALNGKAESPNPGVSDPVLNRTLVVTAHSMKDGPLARIGGDQPFTLVSISDVSPLHKAQRELWALNKSLEEKVRERTAELQQANKVMIREIEHRREIEAAMQASSEDLESLSEQLLNVQESERRRLSAELHDSIEQSLRAIKYSLERVSAMYANPVLGEPAVEIEGVIAQVVACITETRTLVTSLRPLILDDMGPASAIRWLCRHFGDIYRETEFRADVSVADGEIPPSLATPVYRIIQEGLNNVIKHARARAVMVTVSLDNDILSLEVLDDGVGFDTGSMDTTKLKHLGSYGRIGMRRRAINSGGILTLESKPGKGTRLKVEWSLKELELG
jgi:signal transduction histidine kinase/PAS domain-containing protein